MRVVAGELLTLTDDPSDAPKTGDVYIPDNPDAPIMTLSDEDDGIMPLRYGKTHIPVSNYTSLTDYNTSFSCNAADGNRLNIWVRNNGSSTIVLNVDFSKFFGIVSAKYKAVEIAAGGQHTMTENALRR